MCMLQDASIAARRLTSQWQPYQLQAFAILKEGMPRLALFALLRSHSRACNAYMWG